MPGRHPVHQGPGEVMKPADNVAMPGDQRHRCFDVWECRCADGPPSIGAVDPRAHHGMDGEPWWTWGPLDDRECLEGSDKPGAVSCGACGGSAGCRGPRCLVPGAPDARCVGIAGRCAGDRDRGEGRARRAPMDGWPGAHWHRATRRPTRPCVAGAMVTVSASGSSRRSRGRCCAASRVLRTRARPMRVRTVSPGRGTGPSSRTPAGRSFRRVMPWWRSSRFRP